MNRMNNNSIVSSEQETKAKIWQMYTDQTINRIYTCTEKNARNIIITTQYMIEWEMLYQQ